jgi:aryl-alcohol dehydrogenase-like predicted oxidoreductase
MADHADLFSRLDLHFWDWTTPVAEVMQGLNNLVKSGKGELYWPSTPDR